MVYKKGFTLITALLMVLFVSLAMAIIGTVFVKSTQISAGVKVFKTTKEAAQTTANVIIDEIDNGSLSASCNPGCGGGSPCQINLPADLENAIKSSQNIESATAYLISNCTDPTTGAQIYTIKVDVKAKNGATTHIFFIYEK